MVKAVPVLNQELCHENLFTA